MRMCGEIVVGGWGACRVSLMHEVGETVLEFKTEEEEVKVKMELWLGRSESAGINF